MLTPPHPAGPTCFPARHCPLPALCFFTSINIFITWVSSSKSYRVAWVPSDLGVSTPPPAVWRPSHCSALPGLPT